MSTIKRTSRESETKVTKEAKKAWAPPSSLDAPPAPNGYSHRWIEPFKVLKIQLMYLKN